MTFRNLLLVASVVLLSACGRSNSNNRQAEENVEIPADAIQMKYNKHLYFQAVLRDSIPARMVFDTGSHYLILDSAFYASRFGEAKNLRRAMLGGTGDGYELTDLDASDWSYRIGNESHTDQIAIVMNLRKILGDEVDGLFGMPFMMGKRVEFNYAGGYVRFLAAEEPVAEDFTAIECKWLDDKDRRIILPLSVTFADGYTLDGKFLMDTGMPDCLSLNSTTAMRLKMGGHLADARRMVFDMGGIGGSRSESYIRTRQIAIGGKAIDDVRISCSDNEQGALADSRYDGLVGNALFARFDVIFDFERWVMYIRPNKEFDKPQPDFFGVAFRPNADHWVVNALLEGGNAEQAGLRRGDRVVRINGMTPDDPNASALITLPDKLTLTIQRDGSLIEIAVDKE